jgi:RecB family exonuclease
MVAEFRRCTRDPGAALWLTPTDRAADEAKRVIAEAGPVVGSAVLSIRAFAESVAGTASGQPKRRLILDELAGEITRTGRLPFFRRVAETRGFLDGVLGFLDELNDLGTSPAELRAIQAGPRTEKLAACAALATAVRERLPDYLSPLVRAAIVLERGLQPPLDHVQAVFVDGFTSFTPPQWRLITVLAAHANLWVSLPGDDGDRTEAFAQILATRGRLTDLGGVEPPPAGSVGDRPPGLAQVTRHLFGTSGPPNTNANGLSLIEAPGELGEARLVARRIRKLLADGTRPDDIVVTARDLTYSFDLIAEVFDEYGLPIELDGSESVIRNPAVATLLRALRVPDDGWPFAGVTALLRSTYFLPDWPEAAGEAAQRTEVLLRLLGEPRDRESYLRAVRLWAESPPVGLEDEQAEESRRLRKARLAAECRPFIERFFGVWDGLPTTAEPAIFVSAIKSIAVDIGLEAAATECDRDRAALRAFWSAVDEWTGPAMSRAVYLRRLTTVAASVEPPRSERSAGRIRIVPAEEARHLACDYLFVLGLGERSFPRLAPPTSLLDDADRQILRAAGFPFANPDQRLGAEQLLFLQLVGRPRRGLVVSYPAVDEKGQPLLPGSFLRAVRECFVDGAIPTEQQRMLIEGYLTRDPRSPAEGRSHFAARMTGPECPPGHPDLPAALCEQLGWAREVAAARFHSRDFNRYDGWLDSPAALAVVRARFGPERVFSPTALEAYVSCPFRFLLEHALRLEELDEPGEEVEHTRRGAAYHRALARLHERLRVTDPDLTRLPLPESIGPLLLAEIDKAVQEYAQRAPSPASRKLWELEGKRLHRSAAKYAGHWEDFVVPWRKAEAPPAPKWLEADFGLVAAHADPEAVGPLILSVGGVEVRIGGRIDRVDVAELDDGLGFWIIDYKTGRSANYSSAEITRFEKLQLPLYALAVERVFHPGETVRPLGLAYWLVTEKGPKSVLPTRQAVGWLSDPKKWAVFRKQLEDWVAKVVGRIRDGHFPLAPRKENCTETCSFGQVCRITQSRNVGKVWDLFPPGAESAGEESV